MQEVNHQSNPFPGLRPFEAAETHLFFGRDGQSEELLRRLSRTRFLAVVGTSGSGKSSLVRAGLLPALQGGLMASAGSDWRIAILRPGNDPVGNLARALASPAVLGPRDEKSAGMQEALTETTLRRSSLGLSELVGRARTKLDEGGRPLFHDYENLLIVVDQFEEIFRFRQLIEQGNSKEDAAAFVKLLLEAVREPEGKIYVVLTMRSDFLGDCAQFQGLPEAINDGQYLIPRMTRDERREAITGPVAVGEGAMSEPLVNQLLNDVGDNPDQLPIMQHALMRTWDYWLGHRRDGEPIDLPDYEATGGMSEALSRHADEAYGELTDARKVVAEKLFKGLTEKGADNREIRRPMEVQEICELTGADEAEVIAVVEVFRREGRSFLMPPPEDALTGAPLPLTRESLIDISHESLIRNWERLKTWVDEESQSARTYRRLADTAVLHKAGEEALLADPALQMALDWREKNRPNEVWARRYHPEFGTAMSFLDASAEARDAERLERRQRQKREASYKRTRKLVFFLVVSSMLQLAMFAYSYSRNREAENKLKEVNAKLREVRNEKEHALIEQVNAKTLHGWAKEEGQNAKADAAKAKTELADAQKQRRAAEELGASAKRQAEKATADAARAKTELAKAEEERHAAGVLLVEAQTKQKEAKQAQEKAEQDKRGTEAVLYAADMHLAQKEYEADNTERAIELLKEYREPKNKDIEPRGFEWYYLWRLAYRGAAAEKGLPLQGHSDSVTSVAYSPDGKILATGSRDNTVRLWDDSRNPLGTLKGHEDAVTSVAFSPDKATVATGSRDATVRLWNIAALRQAADGTAVSEKKPILTEANKLEHGGIVTAVAFSPDGRTLATTGITRSDRTLRLWDIGSSGVPSEHSLTKLVGRVTSVAFSPDGKTLAAGSSDTTARLWDITDLKNPKQEAALKGHEGAVTSVAFSSDGKTLATGSSDMTARLWDVADLKNPKEVSPLKGHREAVTFVAFSAPEKKMLATGGRDNTVRLWDISSPGEPVQVGKFKDGENLITAGAFSPDGRTLATGGVTKTVRLWNVSSVERTTLRGHKGAVTAAAFASDGRTLATGGEDKTLRLWDVATRKELKTLREHDGAVTSVAFSPGGKWLAAGEGQTVWLWDIATWELKRLAGHRGVVTSVAFSPDALTVASGSETGEVKLWNPVNGQKSRDLPGYEGAVTSVAFSRDGNWLAAGGKHDKVRVWNLATGELKTLARHKGAVTSVAFVPDIPERLVTGGLDRAMKLWNVVTGEEIKTVRGHKGAIAAIAFSPDGKTLATGDRDNTVRLWDDYTPREVATLRGHEGPVTALAFSPDSRTLASASDDSTVRLWLTATEAEVKETKLNWESTDHDRELPPVLGGHENDGTPLYVCRVHYGGETYSGKIVAGNCYIASNGEELVSSEFKLLVGTELKWMSPGEAVKESDWEMFDAKDPSDSKSVNVCRASYEYGVHVGRLKDGPKDKVCSFGYGGKERVSEDYEALYVPKPR